MSAPAAERRKNLATAGRPWMAYTESNEPQSGERIFRRYRGLFARGISIHGLQPWLSSYAAPRLGNSLRIACIVLVGCLLGATAFAADFRPPLVDAAKKGDREAVKTLLKTTNPNIAEPDGTTALHWAAYRDDVEMADLLIKAGAKPNVANDLGATPL